MTDYEVLYEKKIGEQSIRDVGTMTFLGWVANNLTGLNTNVPGVNELAMYIKAPPMGRMSEAKKLEIVRLMEKVGIAI